MDTNIRMNNKTISLLLLCCILAFSCQSKAAYYFEGDEISTSEQIDLSGARWYHFGTKKYSVDELQRFTILKKLSMRLPEGESLQKIGPYHFKSRSVVIFVTAKARMQFHTYFTRDYAHSVHIFQINDVEAGSFSVYNINPLYAHDGQHVYYMHTSLHDADPKTFRLFKEGKQQYYGVDNKNVYIADKRIHNSDGASFEFLNELYAKDRNLVYYVKHFSNAGPASIITDADAESFEVLDLGKYGADTYARDKHYAYFQGKTIPDSHGPSFEVLKSKANIQETIGSGLYAKDRGYAYWNAMPLPDLEIQSFQLLSNRWARDKQSVFFMKQKVVGAHANSFQLIGMDCAKDRSQAYFEGKPIKTQDVASFDIKACYKLQH